MKKAKLLADFAGWKKGDWVALWDGGVIKADGKVTCVRSDGSRWKFREVPEELLKRITEHPHER